MDVAEKVELLRGRLRIGANELSRRIGESENFVSRLKERAQFTPTQLRALARELQTSVDFLLDPDLTEPVTPSARTQQIAAVLEAAELLGWDRAAELLKSAGESKGEWKFIGAVELPLPAEAREAEVREAAKVRRGRKAKAEKGG